MHYAMYTLALGRARYMTEEKCLCLMRASRCYALRTQFSANSSKWMTTSRLGGENKHANKPIRHVVCAGALVRVRPIHRVVPLYEL